MGYAHEPHWPHEAADSLIDHDHLRRRQCRELQPLEARRLLWEGALLVQPAGPGGPAPSGWPGAVVVDPELPVAGIRALLPDHTLPLVCVAAAGSGRPPGEGAARLAERLQDLGYGQVFRFALSSLEGLEAGR